MEAWTDILSIVLTLVLINAVVEDRRAALAFALGVVLIVLRVGVAQRHNKRKHLSPPAFAVVQEGSSSEPGGNSNSNRSRQRAQTRRSPSPSSTMTASPVMVKTRRRTMAMRQQLPR